MVADFTEIDLMADVFLGLLSTRDQADVLGQMARAMGAEMEAAVPEYPEPSGLPRPLAYTDRFGRPSKWASDKQRRYVMALIRQGKVPYRRTGLLGKSITTETEIDAARLTVGVDIGTNAPHAPYVIDEKRQALYHKETWWTLQPVIRGAAPAVIRAGVARFVKAVREKLP